jgi:GTPase Era involved in 16S rRNA processing
VAVAYKHARGGGSVVHPRKIRGTKIVITSEKPQTTRRAVHGIVTRPNAQLVIVDRPA